MSIKVSFDINPLEQKFSSGRIQQTKTIVANQILKDSDRFVPSDGKGALRASGHASGGSAIWNTVYARAHYYGTNGIVTFRKYTTAGTGSKWTEKAEKAHMPQWEQVVKKGLGIK